MLLQNIDKIEEKRKREKMNERKEDLERILENRGIYSVFQPIVSLKTGEVLGYEALSRIQEPKEIENIEELFETAIFYDHVWRLEKLCRKKSFENFSNQKNYQDKKLFVNINPIVIKDKKFRMGFTNEHLSEYQIKKENIIIEITEKGNPKDLEGFQKAIEHYKIQNYKIAMDDVGAGNSGLTMICEISPKYLKLDMKLIRDIHKNQLKRAIVASMVELSNSTKIELIAEGIETESEMKTLIDLGVQYGQGYFLQRPNTQIVEMDQEFVEKIQVLSGINVDILKEASKEVGLPKSEMAKAISDSIGMIARPCKTFSPEIKGEFVYEFFQKNLNIAEICIINRSEKFIGSITRARAVEKFGGPYGYSLNAKKSIFELLNRGVLVVDYELPIEAATRIAMNRHSNQLYDAIVVTKEDCFFGIVTLRDLVLTFIQIELKRAEDENPLTRLPGNGMIQQEMKRVIKQKQPFSIMYLDMDNFKAYNDAYGFGNGDKMISQMADSIKLYSGKTEFIGHVGGDDFVVISSKWEIEEQYWKIVKDFKEKIEFLYNKEDWGRGYIIAKGRDEIEKKFAIVTLSAAVISNQCQKDIDEKEIFLQIAELKKKSKKIEGNSFLMR